MSHKYFWRFFAIAVLLTFLFYPWIRTFECWLSDIGSWSTCHQAILVVGIGR